jgi:glycosyltransferase involved in cell wall biosynthesis
MDVDLAEEQSRRGRRTSFRLHRVHRLVTGRAPARDVPFSRFGTAEGLGDGARVTTLRLRSDDESPSPSARTRRFDRIAITSVFGHPSDPKTWSGAPRNLGRALGDFGIAVEGINPRISRAKRVVLAARYLTAGYGRLHSTEQLLRAGPARRRHARQIADYAARADIGHVLHTGTLDLPALDLPRDTKHYLYCDHTWLLSLRYRPDAGAFTAKAVADFERLEKESFAGLEAIFTFGTFVRDHIVQHYGVPPERVIAVGSGMGSIEPFRGSKDFSRPRLLFVAKHLFEAKGGLLLLDAFHIALRHRPDLVLTIVGDERSRAFVPAHPNIVFHEHLPWPELQRLYHQATLLAQPMLNDPWGQVYLEALVSRTPVLGLDRNGLPEITGAGRHGFLVKAAKPQSVADAIVDAIGDPDRLASMADDGQRHVLTNYTWDRVAERIGLI